MRELRRTRSLLSIVIVPQAERMAELFGSHHISDSSDDFSKTPSAAEDSVGGRHSMVHGRRSLSNQPRYDSVNSDFCSSGKKNSICTGPFCKGSKCWLMLMASGCLIVIAPLCGLIILSGISYHNQIPPGERACAQYEILTTEAVLCGAGDSCTAGGINTSVHTVDGYSANQPITSWLVRKEDLEFYTKQEEPTSFNETLRASDVILGYRNPKYLWTESVISGKCCISNEMETTGTSTLELFPSLQSAFHLSENKPVYEETITLSANSSMCFQNWGPGKPFTVKENGYHFFVLSSNTTVKYIFEMTVTQVFVNATDYKDPNYFTSNNHSIFSFEKCSENGVTKTQVSYVTLCQATEEDVENYFLIVSSCPQQLHSNYYKLWLGLLVVSVILAFVFLAITLCLCWKMKPCEKITPAVQEDDTAGKTSLLA